MEQKLRAHHLSSFSKNFGIWNYQHVHISNARLYSVYFFRITKGPVHMNQMIWPNSPGLMRVSGGSVCGHLGCAIRLVSWQVKVCGEVRAVYVISSSLVVYGKYGWTGTMDEQQADAWRTAGAWCTDERDAWHMNVFGSYELQTILSLKKKYIFNV